MAIKLFTIGFTKKNAARFFGLLRDAGVRRVVDTRLNRTSQLAGFAKEQDLPFLLSEICHAEYETQPLLVPTEEILSAYRKKHIDWETYEERFNELIRVHEMKKFLQEKGIYGVAIFTTSQYKRSLHL